MTFHSFKKTEIDLWPFWKSNLIVSTLLTWQNDKPLHQLGFEPRPSWYCQPSVHCTHTLEYGTSLPDQASSSSLSCYAKTVFTNKSNTIKICWIFFNNSSYSKWCFAVYLSVYVMFSLHLFSCWICGVWSVCCIESLGHAFWRPLHSSREEPFYWTVALLQWSTVSVR